jgi:tRNA (cytidine/uridine-2'-O-)-methyltransferase
MSLHVVLMQPEIPQNTGNIARTCACTGAGLHLVHPLGFMLTERNIRRSGMDYLQQVPISTWSCNREFLDAHAGDELFFFTGQSQRLFSDVDVAAAAGRADVYLVFGRESAGIDQEVLDAFEPRTVRIPMLADRRSLNLSNAAAIGLYEALRQLGYPGLI